MKSTTEGKRALNNDNSIIIDKTARFLMYSGRENELPRKYHKIYSKNGIILKHFSKRNGFEPGKVEDLLQANLFFELNTIHVTESFLVKQEKEHLEITFTDFEKLKKLHGTKKSKLLADASSSDILLERLKSIIELEAVKASGNAVTSEAELADFQNPKWSHEKLFSTFLPEDYEKYRTESKAQANIEKRFNMKLSGQDIFKFNNGLEANSLLSWFQSLLISEPEVVNEHLTSGDFERWLRNSLKERELANICSNLSRAVEEGSAEPYKIKINMLRRLRKTTFESSIHNTVVKPLLKKLKSADPDTVQQTAVKLMELGDERSVEGLIEKLYDSVPSTRGVVMNALAEIGDSRAIMPLIKIFEHSRDNNDKLNAIKALGKFQDKRVRNLVEQSSEATDEVGDEARIIIQRWKSGDS
jgi:hypothetical protein